MTGTQRFHSLYALVAFALLTQTLQAADPPARTALTDLEKKILGEWEGGPCMGTYDFAADGTYRLTGYTPGGNKLAGTWAFRWDELPPKLVLVCKTSDFARGIRHATSMSSSRNRWR
ncbi:MAG: hypothetical protein QM811_28315 [Pirellulales bacterium]